MQRSALALALVLAVALPAAAQTPAPEGEEYGEGLGLIEEGARIILRRLLADMEPMMRDLAGMIDDLSAYHPPERLPNGDIIIRRKIPLVPLPPGEGEETDL
ncbi:MAG: hypothetical protein KJZ85_14340 [Rhodobacteraceae bacterium]|jgi:hypothetical protein|nr:hypothetical protein [Paracoccaceae bacterium]